MLETRKLLTDTHRHPQKAERELYFAKFYKIIPGDPMDGDNKEQRLKRELNHNAPLQDLCMQLPGRQGNSQKKYILVFHSLVSGME